MNYFFTVEDYDIEADTAEEAIALYQELIIEQVDFEGIRTNPNYRFDTTILQMNEECEVVLRYPAWASLNDCYVSDLPSIEPITRKLATFSPETLAEAKRVGEIA